MCRKNPVFDAAIVAALYKSGNFPRRELRQLQEVTGASVIIREWWRYTFSEETFVNEVLAKAFELEGINVDVGPQFPLTLSDKFKSDYEGYLYEYDRDGAIDYLSEVESIRLYFCNDSTVYIDVNYIREVC